MQREMNRRLMHGKWIRFAQQLLAGFSCVITTFAISAPLPAGYPSDYPDIISAAKKEGKVIVYSVTHTAAVHPLINDFEALYPGVKVEYSDLDSAILYNRFVSENAAGTPSADVLWSSAMDLQVKLVNDGYAAAYASPEIPNLPSWAHYQNSAYGTTFEPLAIVYNKHQIAASEVPQTRAELIKLLKGNPKKFAGKVTTYDIEKSGVGFNYLTQDFHIGGNTIWDLVRAMGAANVKLQSSSGTMLERISSGDSLIGYNMIGSYAHARARKDPSIGYVYPRDYTQVLSRLMLITKNARNPNAARLWLDYILSKRGQTVLANQADLFALRSDVGGDNSAAGLTRQLGASLKPVQVGIGLLVYLDQAKRMEFMKTWQQAVKKP